MKIFDAPKIFRSSQLVEAYTTVREILQRFLADDDEWTESLAASAKGSLIYSWTEKEETVEDLVGQTVKAYMRQTDTKYNRCCCRYQWSEEAKFCFSAETSCCRWAA